MSNTNKKALAEMELSFGNGDSPYAVTIAKLPDSVRFALMQRTFSHIMGNEASAAEGRFKAAKDAEGNAKYNANEVAVLVHDWRGEKIASMVAGTFGLRIVGPRLTSDERIMRDFARDAIIAAAERAKRTLPKASDREAWDGLVDQFLAKPVLKAQAEAEVVRRNAAANAEVDLGDLLGDVEAA